VGHRLHPPQNHLRERLADRQGSHDGDIGSITPARYNPLVRRIGRYILGGLTVLSLLLCAGTIGLWARGQRGAYWVAAHSYHRTSASNVHHLGFSLYSERGRLLLFSGVYDLAVATGSKEILEDFYSANEGRHFYNGPPLETTPAIGPSELSKAQVHSHGLYLNARWEPRGTPFWIGTSLYVAKEKALDVGGPAWIAVLLTALFPALRFGSWFRGRRRAAENICPVCSYDLRATPDRCPECGTIPTKVKA
jgi:hypothetical protein